MYKSAIARMAAGTRPVSPITKVDRMFEFPLRVCDCLAFEGLIESRMTDVAVLAYDLAGSRAHMLAVMTAKTSLSVEMPDVVRMRAPVGSHFREEIR